MDNEVDILPHIVIGHGMELEALLRVPVKCLSIDAANKAHILAVIIRLSLLISQLRESIDNDTENNVQQNCDDEQKEGQIIGGSEVEALEVLRCSSLRGQELANTATATKAIVDCRQEAVHHGLADGVALTVEEACVYLVVVERVEEEDEGDC